MRSLFKSVLTQTDAPILSSFVAGEACSRIILTPQAQDVRFWIAVSKLRIAIKISLSKITPGSPNHEHKSG